MVSYSGASVGVVFCSGAALDVVSCSGASVGVVSCSGASLDVVSCSGAFVGVASFLGSGLCSISGGGGTSLQPIEGGTNQLRQRLPHQLNLCSIRMKCGHPIGAFEGAGQLAVCPVSSVDLLCGNRGPPKLQHVQREDI